MRNPNARYVDNYRGHREVEVTATEAKCLKCGVHAETLATLPDAGNNCNPQRRAGWDGGVVSLETAAEHM